jgi:eukaryotic-like serine/threonine-protein kinase
MEAGDVPLSDSLVGRRLGNHDVLARLGAGGMGEVYRARDSKLQRDVALKLLPVHVSQDVERLARFEREARVLASLNHPHIAMIYGVEDSDGVHALVLELVEGPTLAERLGQGPLPVPEAITIARQIADAFDAAHEKGIVHRDLKPDNIKVTPDGIVKVLDFGIAKMRAPDETVAEASTVTTVGTRAGALLGTAAYMSPEQARGQAVDKRTDIWAFGCVLFEMLTGQAVFAGETISDTIARVLEREPDWERLPSTTPANMRRLLRRCLEKDPKQRLRDIGDARPELQETLAPAPDGDRVTGSSRSALIGMAAGLIVVTAAAVSVAMWRLIPTEAGVTTRFSHVLAEDTPFTELSRSLIAIAPDGSSLVYAAGGRLYHRTLNELDAYPIRGTDGAPSGPFFSPDGQTLGYWDAAAGELRRIAVGGGTPVSVTRATALYGANWESDGTIVYGQQDGIWRVSGNGGAPERIVQIDPGELVHGPRMLPGGTAVMFSLTSRAELVGQPTAWDAARVLAQTLQTGQRHEIARGGDARILPTGHLIYALGTVIYAVPIDLATLEVKGAPTPLIEGVQRGVRGSGGQGGSANYDVGSNGTLVYVPGFVLAAGVPRRLLSVDLSGNSVPLIDDERDFWRPRISPDGTRVAVEALRPNSASQVWIVDLERRTLNPVGGERDTGYPVWTPDGKSVIYRRGEGGLYRQPVDGSEGAQLLVNSPGSAFRVMDVSRDGVVAVARGSPQDDIQTFHLGSGVMSEFLATPVREYMASFSPDGRWLAYTSNESGRDEVYVRPFPRTQTVARLVSIDGGSGPAWAPNGSALYYRGASGEMMAVPVMLTPTFTSGRPRTLFRFAGVYRMSGTATAYDIHPDGKRFIMVSERKDAAATPRQQVNIVLNWFEELRRLAPATR